VIRTTGTEIASEQLKGCILEMNLADLNNDEDQVKTSCYSQTAQIRKIRKKMVEFMTMEADENPLVIGGAEVALSHTCDLVEIPLKEHGEEYARESTGVFLMTERIQLHLKVDAKKVVFSALAKDDLHTAVRGVLCAVNGVATVVKAINDAFGIKMGLMMPIQAMTVLLLIVDDLSKKNWRRGRVALGCIIPPSTSAAKAVAKVIPAVKGKFTGMTFRVPTIDVLVVELPCELEEETLYERSAPRSSGARRVT